MKIISLPKKIISKFISKPANSLPVEVSLEDKKIIDYCKKFSMASNERLWATISATKYIVKNEISGAFVECGVWRGGNCIAMAMELMNLGVIDKDFFLFDTFEGMSSPTDEDIDNLGTNATELLGGIEKGDGNNIWCIASLEDVMKNLKNSNYPEDKLHFIKGDVAKTLKVESNLPEKISLLRLDTDWYNSTKLEMEVLFPRLVHGGVCLIDDYGHWQGARKAVDEYLEQHKIFPLLHVTDYTGRAFIKI